MDRAEADDARLALKRFLLENATPFAIGVARD